MSLFVEVTSLEKNCPVIINLEHVIEIAPVISGGCALFMSDGAGMNSRTSIRVSDSYDMFRQFAMQPVTADDIARRFPKAADKETRAKSNIKEQSESNGGVELNIPVFGNKK